MTKDEKVTNFVLPDTTATSEILKETEKLQEEEKAKGLFEESAKILPNAVSGLCSMQKEPRESLITARRENNDPLKKEIIEQQLKKLDKDLDALLFGDFGLEGNLRLSAQHICRVAYIDWLLKDSSKGERALSTIVKEALSLSVLRKLAKGERVLKHQYINILGGGYSFEMHTEQKFVKTHGESARGVFYPLLKLTKKVSDEKKRINKDLYDGVTPQLTITSIADGDQGIAVVYVPREKRYPGGRMKIEVSDGEINILMAAGDFTRSVNALKEENISLPVTFLKEEHPQQSRGEWLLWTLLCRALTHVSGNSRKSSQKNRVENTVEGSNGPKILITSESEGNSLSALGAALAMEISKAASPKEKTD